MLVCVANLPDLHLVTVVWATVVCQGIIFCCNHNGISFNLAIFANKRLKRVDLQSPLRRTKLLETNIRRKELVTQFTIENVTSPTCKCILCFIYLLISLSTSINGIFCKTMRIHHVFHIHCNQSQQTVRSTQMTKSNEKRKKNKKAANIEKHNKMLHVIPSWMAFGLWHFAFHVCTTCTSSFTI